MRTEKFTIQLLSHIDKNVREPKNSDFVSKRTPLDHILRELSQLHQEVGSHASKFRRNNGSDILS